MDIRIQSLKFDADQKLIDFIEKKFSKLPKFYDEISNVEIVLSLLPDHENKNVKVMVEVPGTQILVERHPKTFENAAVDCVDVLKDLLVKAKEKRKEP